MKELSLLAVPFDLSDLEWRIARSGEKNGNVWAMSLTYITARAIMDRLDDVCGVGGWQSEYRDVGGALSCGIGIYKGDDQWVWKWDGTGHLAATQGLDSADAGKGDFSNALKRAGVQWGIGRYLYRLTENFAKVHERGAFKAKTPDGKWFRWDPPAMPGWAMPGSNGKVDADVRGRIASLLTSAAAGGHVTVEESGKIEDALADPDTAFADLDKTLNVLGKWIAENREAPVEVAV